MARHVYAALLVKCLLFVPNISPSHSAVLLFLARRPFVAEAYADDSKWGDWHRLCTFHKSGRDTRPTGRRQERFVHRHVWREKDVLMWDNRCTFHTGTLFDDTKYKRLIYRIMVQGDTPF
jgi:Taurine catabolism dioxygenase TauD, TfdA family